MPRVTYYSLTDDQFQSARPDAEDRVSGVSRAVAIFGVLAIGSGEAFGARVRDALRREWVERILFGSAIIGMIAMEALLYCSRRLHIHNSVTKGNVPQAAGIYVMLMIFLAFFIFMATKSFQNRWVE